MPIYTDEKAAWICAAAGLMLHAAFLAGSLSRQKAKIAKNAWALLLPAALGLLLARGGFALLQAGEELAFFRWCYTTGLWGLMLGTALAARLSGAGAAKTLDGTVLALGLCMGAARLAQRWLGETGIGPLLEEESFLAGSPLAMINDWEEPVLATWLLEAALCVIAGACAQGLGRKWKAPGTAVCLGVCGMMIPQILLEQFRSGHYMRFMMARMEQALFFLTALAAILFLCAGWRKRGGASSPRVYGPALGFLPAAGVIVLVQFVLDGKVAEWPEALCWALYGAAIAAMLVLAVFAAARLNRAAKEERA